MADARVDRRYDRALGFVQRELPGDRDRECYQCGRAYGAHELAMALVDGSAAVQSFTGRVFCLPGCFDDYRDAEGF